MDLDPFEARLEFLTLLGKVNASQHSIHKVGSFAMRNKNLYEDLYSCIIEEMDQTSSINTRMNLFYVLDSICQHSHKARFSGYIDLVRKNLASIITKVTPSGPKGDVNVAATRKVLDTWRTRKIFPENVIEQVQTPLLSRGLATKAPTAETGLTQDDIIRRMEEDRERHKRIREEIWIRPQDEDVHGEFLQHWDDVSDMDEKDYEELVAENAKHLPDFPWTEEFDRWRTLGAKRAGSALAFGSNTPAGGVQKRRKLPPVANPSVPERTQTAQVPAVIQPAATIPNPITANKPTPAPTTTTAASTPATMSTRPVVAARQPPAPLSAANPPSANTAPPLTLKSYVEATKSPVRRLSAASSSSSISSVPTTDPNSSLSSSPMSYSAAPSPPPAPTAPPPRVPPPSRTSAPASAPSAAPVVQRALPPPLTTSKLAPTPAPSSNSNAHAPTAATLSSPTTNHTQRTGGSRAESTEESTPSTPTSATTSTPVSASQATSASTPVSSGGERLSLQQYLQQQRLLRAGATSASSSSSLSSAAPAAAVTTTPILPAPVSPPPPSHTAPSSLASSDVSATAAAAAAAAGYFPVPATSGRRPSGQGRSHSSSYS
ncbi:hypothetical protein BGZ73_002733 [Actinomortierella ambigua]|nr:hypothetical protein BGZ73_002733 [Actinomortierella ambigua]